MKGKKEQKSQQVSKKTRTISANSFNSEKTKYYSLLGAILVITCIAYLPVLHNGLLSWDDDRYIKDNPLIYSINLKEIFSQNVMGNYHPLTILALAIEFKFFGLSETGYHLVNLFLHLLNIVLVFRLIMLLCNNAGVALIASLFFGIHPMHVESVAWAAELKDLLYTLFYLASCIFYLKYLKDLKRKFYVFALLLFSLSLLSKAMAASLPVVLFLIDYFRERKISATTLIEKVPFFVLAIVFGVIAVLAQGSSDAIQDIAIYSFPQRIIFACYGYISYLYKLILPIHLNAYYPYPVRQGEAVPAAYYAYVLLFAGLVAGVIYSLRVSKKMLFGFGFFTITILLVLQLLPVGDAIMADRYSYIPSIGFFYLAGEGFELLYRKKYQWVAFSLLGVCTVLFSIKTYSQCGIWKDEMTLWNAVIAQDPNVYLAYNNRGVILMDEKKYDRALEDYNKALELKPDYANAFSNRGIALMNYNKFEEALADYTKAIALNPKLTEAYVNRGNVLRDKNKHEEALRDYAKAIELRPDYPKAFVNRGTLFIYEKKNDDALRDINKAIELKPDFAEAYYNRGIAYYNKAKYLEAIADYTKAISLNSGYYEAYFNRGVALYYAGNKTAACDDLKMAAQLGYRVSPEVIQQFCQ